MAVSGVDTLDEYHKVNAISPSLIGEKNGKIMADWWDEKLAELEFRKGRAGGGPCSLKLLLSCDASLVV